MIVNFLKKYKIIKIKYNILVINGFVFGVLILGGGIVYCINMLWWNNRSRGSRIVNRSFKFSFSSFFRG